LPPAAVEVISTLATAGTPVFVLTGNASKNTLVPISKGSKKKIKCYVIGVRILDTKLMCVWLFCACIVRGLCMLLLITRCSLCQNRQ
jgi:hypothetical protein